MIHDPSGQSQRDSRLDAILAQIADRTHPPVETWAPETVGESGMVIHADGTWTYRGSPINRPRMVKLFARILRKEGEDHYLVTPAEKLRIAVADAPFLAVEAHIADMAAGTTLFLRTNMDDWVMVDAAHPVSVKADAAAGSLRPYAHVGRGLMARVTRPVYYELAEMAVPGEKAGRQYLGIWSAGVFFPLGPSETE